MKTLSLTSPSSIRCDIPAQKDRSSLANSQVRKGGLPPLERQRRDWLLQPSSSSPPVKPEVFHLEKKCFHLEGSFAFRGDNTQAVAPLALERGQATLPHLQITVRSFAFSHSRYRYRSWF